MVHLTTLATILEHVRLQAALLRHGSVQMASLLMKIRATRHF